MVMGNSIAAPTLLGKAETISALIAMEMGIAEVGSTHYSALYAAGLSLMLLLFAINIIFELLKRRHSIPDKWQRKFPKSPQTGRQFR